MKSGLLCAMFACSFGFGCTVADVRTDEISDNTILSMCFDSRCPPVICTVFSSTAVLCEPSELQNILCGITCGDGGDGACVGSAGTVAGIEQLCQSSDGPCAGNLTASCVANCVNERVANIGHCETRLGEP